MSAPTVCDRCHEYRDCVTMPDDDVELCADCLHEVYQMRIISVDDSDLADEAGD